MEWSWVAIEMESIGAGRALWPFGLGFVSGYLKRLADPSQRRMSCLLALGSMATAKGKLAAIKLGKPRLAPRYPFIGMLDESVAA